MLFTTDQSFAKSPEYLILNKYQIFAGVDLFTVRKNYSKDCFEKSPKMAWTDTTQIGYAKGKLGMWFIKNINFRSALGSFRYAVNQKNTGVLSLPKECKHYCLVFEDQFDTFNTAIWQIGQPWGRLHPQFPHQFYGDGQVYASMGILHLLMEAKSEAVKLSAMQNVDRQRIEIAAANLNKQFPKLMDIRQIQLQYRPIDTSVSAIIKDDTSLFEKDLSNIRIQKYYVPDTSMREENSVVLSNLPQKDSGSLGEMAVIVPYSVGLVNTFHSQNFTYGYFAARSKNPSGSATWPAWWLSGKKNWPPEIDIFEMYGGKKGRGIHTQTMTIHTGKIENQNKGMVIKKLRLPRNTDTTFHIYACLWTPKKIDFYTDGIKVKTIRLNHWMAQFYQEPMYLILNNGIESAYISNLQDHGNPSSDFQIDWIQVFQPPVGSANSAPK